MEFGLVVATVAGSERRLLAAYIAGPEQDYTDAHPSRIGQGRAVEPGLPEMFDR
jgi:hypothetical protein